MRFNTTTGLHGLLAIAALWCPAIHHTQGGFGQQQPKDKIVVLRNVSPTSTGTQDFTSNGLGDFVGAVFIVSGADTDGGSPLAHGRICIGFCSNDVDGMGRPEQQCISQRARQEYLTIDDAVTSAQIGVSNVIVVPSPSNRNVSGASAVAKATEVLSNGVRLEWTNVDTIQYKITCILIGGQGDSFTDHIQMLSSTGGFTNTLVDNSYGILADMYFIAAFEGN